MDKKITICVDFDGVLRNHKTGKPIEGALTAVKWLESKGRQVIVCTAREDLNNVDEWLTKYGFDKTATNIKPRATCYVDDRGLRFISWDDVCNHY